MMHLLLHQASWPAILDLKSVGTGPSSRPILLPFRGNFCVSSGVFEILESDQAQRALSGPGDVFYKKKTQKDYWNRKIQSQSSLLLEIWSTLAYQ